MNRFWNPLTERLSEERLRAIQLRRFKEQLAYAKQNSPFFGEKFKGVDPEDIKGLEDIRALPVVEKSELRAAQEGKEPFPFGELLGVPYQEVSHFRQTSGTTGTPVYVPESYESWQWRVEIWCHILWMAGFRDTDRVFIPFGYNVYVAFWEGHYAAEKLGCMVIPGGALDSKGRIEKIRETKATALLNTPTYGLHLGETAQQMGIDPRSLGVRRMLCAGEVMPPATRKRLEDIWGADVYDHIGGTEACAWAAMCEEKEGLHIMEPYFLVEILDLETISRDVKEDELGVAVVTPLGRHSFPLVRFNTKDMVIKGSRNCGCGRQSQKIKGVVGRADDLKKIRGVLFSPFSVEEVLRSEFGEINEYEIIVTKKGVMDSITLRVEPFESLSKDREKELVYRLKERLKVKTNLTFEIIVADLGELPRYALKARRFKDLREER
ncbi:MAG: phenylacetate--CoA ligase family protein [Desulfatiglandales bacterium]